MLLRATLLASALTAFGAGATIATYGNSTKPNFIFVLADDWGWGDTGFNDAQIKRTPSLDKWAKQGVILSDFHTASPVCSPSRAGFMTGRAPARFRIHTALSVDWGQNENEGQADYLPAATPTVTRLLQQAGYRVGHFGKWHLGSGPSPAIANESAPMPAAYGIDESCTFNSNDACVADGSTYNTSVDIVSRAEAFVRSAKAAGAPFYLNLWLHVSHDKLDPSAEQKAAAGGLAGAHCKARNLATNQTECARLIFDAAQHDADAQLGTLNDLLGELNLHESTLILFSTDNGPEEQLVYLNAQGSAGPFRGRKRSLYEGGTRVPSFAVWKGTITAGAVEHTPFSALDWLPTVAAFAGLPLPAGLELDGEDMSHVLLRPGTGPRLPVQRTKPLFWEWRYGVSGPCDNVAPHLAVRDGDWKFMCNADGSRPELYRLDLYNASGAGDFHERLNLAAVYPQEVARLKKALLSWRNELPKPCSSYTPNPPCEHYTGGPYAPATPAAEVEAVEERPHDSDPDFWVEPESGRVMYWD